MRYISIIASSVVFLFASTTTRADLVTITPDDCILGDGCWTSNITSAFDASDVESIVGESDLMLFYKSDQGGDEEGIFANSYETTFSNTATDPEDALIEYILGEEQIDCFACYLVVKDGNHEPAQYIFDLSDLSYLSLVDGWDGLSPLFLDGFWPDGGAISHVAIFGVVPLPAAFWLFGTALIGFIGISRRTAV